MKTKWLCFYAVIILALTCLGCGTVSAPMSASGVTPRSAAEVFDCTVARLNGFDFTVQQADRASGLIVAQKKTKGAPTFISGVLTSDKITASIFPDDATKQTTLRLNFYNSGRRCHDDGKSRQARRERAL